MFLPYCCIPHLWSLMINVIWFSVGQAVHWFKISIPLVAWPSLCIESVWIGTSFGEHPGKSLLLLVLIKDDWLRPYDQYNLLGSILPLPLNHFSCHYLKLHTCCFSNSSKYFLVCHTALQLYRLKVHLWE